MSHVHITLVGGQPAPVYHGIVALKPDKVIYIYSSSSVNTVRTLQSEITIPSEKIQLHPTDPHQILDTATRLSQDYAEEIVTVNISSGLKSWSHLFGIVFDKLPNASIVYMDQNNVLWDYRTMTSSTGFVFDMKTLFRLYGNPINRNYTLLTSYTEEDRQCAKEIEALRKCDVAFFNKLTTALTAQQTDMLRSKKIGRFEIPNSRSYVEWLKFDNGEPSQVNLCLEGRQGRLIEKKLISKNIISLVFNSGWFEYKVATLFASWDKAKEVIMNCKFPSKHNVDKNEVDIIVNTGTKLLFVECKTQIHHTTDIDKFANVVRAYGGTGSKGLFITDAPLKELSKEKMEQNKLLSFSLQDQHMGMRCDHALYLMLDLELFNINL